MVHDPAGIDVEAGKERSVEDGPDGFVTVLVGSYWRFQERQGVVEDGSSSVEVVLSLGERLLDLRALLPDGGDLCPELVLGPALVGSQVQEVTLLAIKRIEPLLVLVAQGVAEVVVILDRLVHSGSHLGQPLGGQGHSVAVVAHDGVFQDFDRYKGQVA